MAVIWAGEEDSYNGRAYFISYEYAYVDYYILSKSIYDLCSVRLVCDSDALTFIKWYWNTYGSFDHQLS